MPDYVHGYSGREAERLIDQANALTHLLHRDTAYPPGSLVLEAGCGIGAQTFHLAAGSPGATIVSIDLSRESLCAAQAKVCSCGAKNVTHQQADIYRLPFRPGTFDHIFVCFVLEHLSRPREALAGLGNVLKPGGTITVIEGDHGSAYFHPESPYALKAIQCLIDLQAAAGGNSLIGRELYPLLTESGFQEVQVSPRMVYVDASRPELVEGFTNTNALVIVA